MPSTKDKGDYLEITTRTAKVIFKKQCKLTRTINDLLVGMFFVFGSLLNFVGIGDFLANLLYLFGSLILASRAVFSIIENVSVDHGFERVAFEEAGCTVEEDFT